MSYNFFYLMYSILTFHISIFYYFIIHSELTCKCHNTHKKGKNNLNIGNIGEIFCGTDMRGRGAGVQDSKLTIEILLAEEKDRRKP